MLGLLHGPAELMPVSSSAHTTLVPWLLGWDAGAQDPGARKRFEVALHAGAMAALLAGRRRRRVPARIVILAGAPAALAGATLRRAIERRGGTPSTIAAGLAGGAALMALAEHRGGRGRRIGDVRDADGLVLGAAQALALLPGVSRSGATRAAARWRGFDRKDARALSDAVGLPITLAAVVLESADALTAPRGEWPGLATGAAAAFASTLVSDGVARRARAGGDSLTPFAVYRVALAAAAVRRLRQNPKR